MELSTLIFMERYMRQFQTLHNGKVKIARGRFGGDTTRLETKQRRRDRAFSVLRREQQLERITREAMEDCRDWQERKVGQSAALNSPRQPMHNQDRPQSRSQPALVTVPVVRRRPAIKVFIREDGKICATALH